MRIVFMSFAILSAQAAPGWTQHKVASWLDEATPAAWNEPGATLPPAPKVEGAINPRCREAARPPQLDEDQRVRDYVRYSAADALCCPSRTTTVVFEIAGDPPIVRPVAASTSPTSATPPANR
jgi:hypothetical protein